MYTVGAYASGDLDFVREAFLSQDVEAVMGELGFHKNGRHYRHPNCPHLFVEFVSGPLGIGEDNQIEPAQATEGETTIKLLSPTDSVRDRLCGFIHFRSRDYMDQAVLVASTHPVDWEKIEHWCRGEGPNGLEAFVELRRRVPLGDTP